MIKRWILYLTALIGCTVFFAAHQGWVSWVVLSVVLWTPLLSLAVSLAPMLLVKVNVQCPDAVVREAKESLSVDVHCPLPTPPWQCKFRISHTMTGETLQSTPGDTLPTNHCGALLCSGTALYVYDYIGMFRLRLRRIPDKRILIRPQPIATKPPQELDRFLSRAWKPKHGGGFAEQHDLRLYRPGDSLNQVHWKLTAKTGKFIVREPMVPQPGLVLLTMDLSGTPEQLDYKLGQLVWMSRHLLDQGLQFTLRVSTKDGVWSQPVPNPQSLSQAIDTLLLQSPSTDGTILDNCANAAWHYHIGGDDHEA